MSLDDKSRENLAVAQKCIDNNKNNAAANRMYYSVFQKIKHFLTEHKFDYKKFLNEKVRSDREQREYSHGTIRLAIIQYSLDNSFIGLPGFDSLGYIDQIYNARYRADYEKKDVGLTENEINFSYVKDILDFIDRLPQ